MQEKHSTDQQQALQSAVIALDILVPDTDYEEQRRALVEKVNELLVNNFDKLISILYRLDVNEARLKKFLEENAGQDAAVVIAGLIIERQLQKIKSRKEFHRDDTIDENEKW